MNINDYEESKERETYIVRKNDNADEWIVKKNEDLITKDEVCALLEEIDNELGDYVVRMVDVYDISCLIQSKIRDLRGEIG